MEKELVIEANIDAVFHVGVYTFPVVVPLKMLAKFGKNIYDLYFNHSEFRCWLWLNNYPRFWDLQSMKYKDNQWLNFLIWASSIWFSSYIPFVLCFLNFIWLWWSYIQLNASSASENSWLIKLSNYLNLRFLFKHMGFRLSICFCIQWWEFSK